MRCPAVVLMAPLLAVPHQADAFAVVGYPVCAAACMQAATPVCAASGVLLLVVQPQADAPMAACAAAGATLCLAGCVCFDEETTVETRGGVRAATAVASGEDVMTLAGGRPTWTKMRNKYLVHGGPAGFDFVTLHSPPNWLTVTREHPVFVNVSGRAAVWEAGRIAVGDGLFSAAREASGRATAIMNVTRPRKLVLETDDGSILANGIWVGSPLRDEILVRGGGAESSDLVLQKHAVVDVL